MSRSTQVRTSRPWSTFPWEPAPDFWLHGIIRLLFLWGFFNLLVLSITWRSSCLTSSNKRLIFPVRTPASSWTIGGLDLFSSSTFDCSNCCCSTSDIASATRDEPPIWCGEGKKKNKTSKKEETSDNIRRWKLTWALCTDNACHLCSYVTRQAGARKATWQLLHNMAAVFANTKTHSGLKQIIVYHGHETTLIGDRSGNTCITTVKHTEESKLQQSKTWKQTKNMPVKQNPVLAGKILPWNASLETNANKSVKFKDLGSHGNSKT